MSQNKVSLILQIDKSNKSIKYTIVIHDEKGWLCTTEFTQKTITYKNRVGLEATNEFPPALKESDIKRLVLDHLKYFEKYGPELACRLLGVLAHIA